MCARVGTASCQMCHRTTGYRIIGVSFSRCAATLPSAVVPPRWTARQPLHMTIGRTLKLNFKACVTHRIIGRTLKFNFMEVVHLRNVLCHRTHPIAIGQDSPRWRRLPCACDGGCADRTSAVVIGSRQRAGSRDAPAGPSRLRGGVHTGTFPLIRSCLLSSWHRRAPGGRAGASPWDRTCNFAHKIKSRT